MWNMDFLHWAAPAQIVVTQIWVRPSTPTTLFALIDMDNYQNLALRV